MIAYFFISPIVCFCTTWEKKTNKKFHFNHFGIIA